MSQVRPVLTQCHYLSFPTTANCRMGSTDLSDMTRWLNQTQTAVRYELGGRKSLPSSVVVTVRSVDTNSQRLVFAAGELLSANWQVAAYFAR